MNSPSNPTEPKSPPEVRPWLRKASTCGTIAEIKRRLAEPIPRDLISVRPVKNKDGSTRDIHYVNVTDYKDLLDERVGHWDSVVQNVTQIGNSVAVVVRILVFAADGIVAQDGTGIENLNASGYGDPFSNAYAQAFRRACETHGLSRDL